ARPRQGGGGPAPAEATESGAIGFAYVDLSTGDFRATEFSGKNAEARLQDEIGILRPREILIEQPAARTLFPGMESEAAKSSHAWGGEGRMLETRIEDWVFEANYSRRVLEEQFRVAGLEGYGLDGHGLAVAAAGAIVHYLRETSAIGAQRPGERIAGSREVAVLRVPEGKAAGAIGLPSGTGLEHLDQIVYYEQRDAMALDQVTARNLELVEPTGDDTRATLLHAMDETATGMGARLLRAWMLRPEIRREEIEARLDAVAALRARTIERAELRRDMERVLDLERLTSRATLGVATPRDLRGMRESLEHIPRLRALLAELSEEVPAQQRGAGVGRIAELRESMDELADVREQIARGIADDPPAVANEPGVIRRGFNAELDELRDVMKDGRQIIAGMEERERKRTGIGSLKIRYNQVFGFYIEISKANMHLAPANYERKQTLANAERFTTPELKALEQKVLTAEDKVLELERRIYGEIREAIAHQAARLRRTAASVAQTDVLVNFARLAADRNYTRPEFTEESAGSERVVVFTGAAEAASQDDGQPQARLRDRSGKRQRGELMIAGGRHPAIERLLEERAERFVPNDLYLEDGEQFLLVITGPNMGGKSTYLRQTALIQIMAQMGSYVPVARARLPIVDRIFTRIGASDNLARGRSTFLVEMSEVAAILNTATPASLVLLDEVGRGTSTFDGLSIAWAVVESLWAGAQPRTLFATHYHELTELEELLPGVQNVHVSVQETGNEIVFLRRVEPGSADKSYGIEVARLAGLPQSVIDRAREILRRHEESEEQLSGELSFSARGDGGETQIAGRGQPRNVAEDGQRSFTAIDGRVLDALREADLDRLTPIEALNLLAALKAQMK
ncbi:MAG: hypothetical protein WAL51_11410, partial [Candidatus Acidiferrales bacterium]